MTVSIYDYATGDVLTQGLQGSLVTDEAMTVARRMADRRGDPVILDDDDGSWLVPADGSLATPYEWPDSDVADIPGIDD